MWWFIAALIVYPSTQKAAQHEIDIVVGRSRMPSFEDYDKLPYVRAMVKEILRWRCVVPLGVPHSSTQDDWYEGYFILKGTLMVPNIWFVTTPIQVLQLTLYQGQ